MSASSAISNVAATLRFLANSAKGRVGALLEQATQQIEEPLPRKIGRAKYDINRPSGGGVEAPELSVRNPTVPELPTPGALQDFPWTAEPFSIQPPAPATLPPRKLPEIQWRDLPGSHPVLTPPTLTPQAPTLSEPTSPRLRPPERIAVSDPVIGPPPTLERPPELPEFTTRPLDLYREGLAIAQGPLGGLSGWLASIRGHSKAAEAALLAQLRAALSGTPVLSEGWERQNSGLAILAIEADRRSGLEALDAPAGTQTGMPTGARIAQKLEVELNALRALLSAAAESAQARQGHQIKHLIQAVETAGRMADRALELRAKEADWIMSAWDAILDGADAAAAVLKQTADWERKRHQWTAQYNRFQASRLGSFTQIEKAKLRRLQVEQGNDANISAYNRSASAAWQIASQFIEQRIQLFEQQVSWLGEDEQWRLLAWRGYELDIQRYGILVKRGTVERRLLQARLEQDQLRIQAEQQNIQRYAAQLEALSAESRQAGAQAKTIAAKNRSALDLFNTQLEAQADLARSLSQELKQAVAALLKASSAEVREQELELRKQELADRRALHKAAIKLQEEHTELMAAIKQHERLIRQRLARGKTQVQGASVLGGIATQATAGFNAIGVSQTEEMA